MRKHGNLSYFALICLVAACMLFIQPFPAACTDAALTACAYAAEGNDGSGDGSDDGVEDGDITGADWNGASELSVTAVGRTDGYISGLVPGEYVVLYEPAGSEDSNVAVSDEFTVDEENCPDGRYSILAADELKFILVFKDRASYDGYVSNPTSGYDSRYCIRLVFYKAEIFAEEKPFTVTWDSETERGTVSASSALLTGRDECNIEVTDIDGDGEIHRGNGLVTGLAAGRYTAGLSAYLNTFASNTITLSIPDDAEPAESPMPSADPSPSIPPEEPEPSPDAPEASPSSSPENPDASPSPSISPEQLPTVVFMRSEVTLTAGGGAGTVPYTFSDGTDVDSVYVDWHLEGTDIVRVQIYRDGENRQVIIVPKKAGSACLTATIQGGDQTEMRIHVVDTSDPAAPNADSSDSFDSGLLNSLDTGFTVADTWFYPGNEWNYDAPESISLCCSGPYSMLTGVYVDGIYVPPVSGGIINYTVTPGENNSTSVNFSNEWLSSLTHGKHYAYCTYSNGVTSYTRPFYCISRYGRPVSGDVPLYPYITAAVMSLAGSIASARILRRKQK